MFTNLTCLTLCIGAGVEYFLWWIYVFSKTNINVLHCEDGGWGGLKAHLRNRSLVITKSDLWNYEATASELPMQSQKREATSVVDKRKVFIADRHSCIKTRPQSCDQWKRLKWKWRRRRTFWDLLPTLVVCCIDLQLSGASISKTCSFTTGRPKKLPFWILLRTHP